MKIHNAYLAMIKTVTGGWDAMAERLGISRASLQNRIYGVRGQSVDVDLALQMQAVSESSMFAEAIATASGGVFVKLPNVDYIDNDDLLAKVMELQTELGTLTSTFLEAINGDGEIDSRERSAIESIKEEMHKTLSELTGLMFRIYCKPPVSIG